MTSDNPPDRPRSAARAFTAMLNDCHLATANSLPDVASVAWRHLGADVVIHLVDYEQRYLLPWLPTGVPPRPPLPINATLAGRVYRLTQPALAKDGDAPVLWLPLLDGVERLGVLEVGLARDADPDDPGLREELTALAALTGHLVTIKGQSGDAIDAARRLRTRTAAAELLWGLLPPLTFGCQRLVIAGMLEPAYEVGGDAFDYAVTADTAHLLILDAMGHSMDAGLTAAAALAAYRTCRREGRGLIDTALVVDDTLSAQFHGERFATGVMAELDLETGRLRYLAAGHPNPLVLRRGKVVKELRGGRRVPFGLDGLTGGSAIGCTSGVEVGQEWLEPGDAVLFHTDGVTEARTPAGVEFGLDRLIDLLEREATGAQPAPETLRQLVHAVMAYQDGVLQDDATLLLAHWTHQAQQQLTPV
jgi:sigma-B regulation protein RsbU (phosphoserine phosphatase)